MSSEKGWRGGEQQLAYLLDGLGDRNVENILAVRKGSKLDEFGTKNGIKCYPLKFAHSFDLGSAREISRICKSEKVDLIHLHSSKAQGVGVLSSTFYGNRVPMVLSRRVTFQPGKNMFSLWKYNHRQIKSILCVSEKIREIMRGYIADGTKCVTVYSGIALDKFKDLRRDRDLLVKDFQLDAHKPIVVTVGAIDGSKDHFTFIDVIARLVAEGHAVQGLIVGDGPLAVDVKSHAIARGVGDVVVFAGQRRDVGRILISSDVFMMTSKEEGLGTSILDAFLAQVPVVATNAGGIPEIVRDEETGLIGGVGDGAGLSRQVARILTDSELRSRVVARASDFVRDFSKENMSLNTYEVYRQVLNNI
jgi:glycosyltransferase involved in cell wall biosynthesis